MKDTERKDSVSSGVWFLRLSWTVVSIVGGTFSILSMFGTLGTIALSEYLARVVESFRSIFHPISEFISFGFEFNEIQKDFVWIAFFVLDRAVSVFLGRAVAGNNKNIDLTLADMWARNIAKWLQYDRAPRVIAVCGEKIFWLAVSVCLVGFGGLSDYTSMTPEALGVTFFWVVALLPAIFCSAYLFFEYLALSGRVVVRRVVPIAAWLAIRVVKWAVRSTRRGRAEEMEFRVRVSRTLVFMRRTASVYIINLGICVLLLLVLGINHALRQ